MSKDIINPKRYTGVEKLGKDVKEGDTYWHYLHGWHKAVFFNGKNDLKKDKAYLCRVPSSTIMSKEEFFKKHFVQHDTSNKRIQNIMHERYEGYLIGRRSIVPEITIIEFEKQFRKSFLHGGNEKDHTTRENMLKFFTNYLRSQINK